MLFGVEINIVHMENIDSGNIFLDIVDSLNNFDSFVKEVENIGLEDEKTEDDNSLIDGFEFVVEFF